MLTREQILDCPDLKQETIDVPEWGGQVMVSQMTVGQREEYARRIRVGDEVKNVMAWLVALSVVDVTTGKPIFTEADIDALNGKNPKAMQRIVAVATRLNAIGEDAVETAIKN